MHNTEQCCKTANSNIPRTTMDKPSNKNHSIFCKFMCKCLTQFVTLINIHLHYDETERSLMQSNGGDSVGSINHQSNLNFFRVQEKKTTEKNKFISKNVTKHN